MADRTAPEHDPNRRVRVDDLVAGARAGVVATLAMSAVMLASEKLGWEGGQPPERIVEAALDAVGAERSERTENVLASLSHLAYGALVGAAYRALRQRAQTPGPPSLHGMAFGLAVWSANYQGWVQWAGILPPPRHDRPGRPRTMILAHLVYGGILGTLAEPPERNSWP